jgi:hypothetical protein
VAVPNQVTANLKSPPLFSERFNKSSKNRGGFVTYEPSSLLYEAKPQLGIIQPTGPGLGCSTVARNKPSTSGLSGDVGLP